MVRGKLQRNRERITVRGLNRNHNHDLKNLLKGAAISAIHDYGRFVREEQIVGVKWRLHSVESHCITRLESVGALEAHFHPYGWAAGP